MTMTELAMEYRESGLLLKTRIAELRQKLKTEDMCEMEKFRLRGRIDSLSKIEREVSEIAVFLERYYERGRKKNGRYSV